MYCTNCGAKLKDGANFCTECGSKVKKSQAKLEKENVDPKDYTKKNVEDKKIEKKDNPNTKEDKNDSGIINKGKYRQFFAGSKDSKINPDDSIKNDISQKSLEENTNTENLGNEKDLSKDYKAKKDISSEFIDENLQSQNIEKTASTDTNLSLDENSFEPKEKIQQDSNFPKDDAYTQKLDLSKLDEKKNTASKDFESRPTSNLSNKEFKDYQNSLKTKANEKNTSGLVKVVSYIGLAFMLVFAFVYLIDLFSIFKSIIGGIF